MRALVVLLIAISGAAAPPQRIVSTAPSITETLFALGLGPHLVGVTTYCRFPEQVVPLPKIGTFLTPDVEAIIALHPDLVVVQKQPNHLAEQLTGIHIPYVEVQSNNLNDIYRGAIEIGKATGKSVIAERFVAKMKADLAAVRQRTAPLSKPTVLFLVGHNPGRLEALIAGAGGSYFSDLLQDAGARNVLNDAVSPYPNISLEQVLSRDPDFILEMSGDSPQSQQEVVSLWRNHTTLRAVNNRHIFAVLSAPFVVPGPRAVEAVRVLQSILHPNAPR